jgi:hypothetical protein
MIVPGGQLGDPSYVCSTATHQASLRRPAQLRGARLGTFPPDARFAAVASTIRPTEVSAAMYSIFYIIGVVVVILAVLSLLGLA